MEVRVTCSCRTFIEKATSTSATVIGGVIRGSDTVIDGVTSSDGLWFAELPTHGIMTAGMIGSSGTAICVLAYPTEEQSL
jgi:hypothetical protein